MAYKEYPAQNRYMTQSFKGLNCHERVGDGEWTDMLNLTADEYPVEKTRAKRKRIQWYEYQKHAVTDYASDIQNMELTLITAVSETPAQGNVRIRLLGVIRNATCLHSDSATYFATDDPDGALLAAVQNAMQQGTVYVEVLSAEGAMTPGKPVDAAVIDEDMYLATDAGYVSKGAASVATGAGLAQLVPIGRQLYTNNGYFMDQSLTNVRRTFLQTTGAAEITLTNDECEDLTPATTKPSSPSNGDYYYNPENGGLYRYSTSQGQWIAVTESYVKLTFVDAYSEYNTTTGQWDAKTADYPDLSGFRAGDAVRIMIGGNMSSYIVHKADDTNHVLTLNGIIDICANEQYATEPNVRVELPAVTRRLPVFDFICEHNNRIWGCRYGLNDEDEFVNEIYTCAQGDPLNWYRYEGTAADAWTTSVGEPGPWTGCCECGRYVLFFKADKVFVVSGDEPANFGYEALDDWGVQAGSGKSITVIDNYVYYKSQHGVMRIGVNSYPVCISRALGYDRWTQAVGGTDGRKYYLSMADGDARSLYVYDTETGIWTRESEPCEELALMIRYKNNLLAVGAEETDTLCGIDVAYDRAASTAARRTNPATWAGKEIATQSILAMNLPALASYLDQSTVEGLVTALETAAGNGTYFVTVDVTYAYSVDYVYISNEKPADLAVVAGQYGFTNFVLTRTEMYGETYDEDDFAWSAVTGPLALEISDEKRIRTVQIRLKSGENARLNVYAAYDESEDWTRILLENTGRKGTFKIDWTPEERCGSFRLRFAGIGETVIYSIAIETEDAGDNVR